MTRVINSICGKVEKQSVAHWAQLLQRIRAECQSATYVDDPDQISLQSRDGIRVTCPKPSSWNHVYSTHSRARQASRGRKRGRVSRLLHCTVISRSNVIVRLLSYHGVHPVPSTRGYFACTASAVASWKHLAIDFKDSAFTNPMTVHLVCFNIRRTPTVTETFGS